MSYATVEEFVEAFGAREADMLADRNNDGCYDHPVIQQGLDTASMQIDGAVGQRCPLPLPNDVSPQVRGQLRQWCLDIARYRLAGASGTVTTDDITDRYREAKSDLDKVVAGKLFICRAGTVDGNGQAGLSPENGSVGEAFVVGSERVFQVGNMPGFMGRL